MMVGMGYIGLDSGRLYRMRRGPKLIEAVASGTTIIINDATEGCPFRGLRVFGKSTQDGTPTPEVPAPIVNTGEGGSITVEVTGRNLLKPNSHNTYYEFPLKANTVMTLMTNGKPSQGGNIKFSATDGSTVWFSIDAGQTRVCRSIGSKDIKGFYDLLSPDDGLEYMFAVGDIKTYTPYVEPQSLTLQTPNGLPGVPVSKDGNYTDQNGQQWVCDEIDLARGKYVQRIGHNANVNDWVRMPGNSDIESTTSRFALNIENIDNYMYSPCICNRLSYAKVDSYGTEGTYATINEPGSKRIFARIEGITSLEDFRAAMPDLEVIWLLETPIETDLPAEEIAAYKALRTYGPTTVVSNDAGAGMEVTYVADTKTYIDNKFAALNKAVLDAVGGI